MKAIFPTAEIIALMMMRTAPKGTHPQFRLQNFLLGKKDWETNNSASMHIGEQGELIVLRYALGKIRVAKIDRVLKLRCAKLPGGAKIFPTKKDFEDFVREVKKVIGNEIDLYV